ncbi:MAG: DinB family protein [Deltaproteobacteria bacterium]
MPTMTYNEVLSILASTPEKIRREVAAMTARNIKTRPAAKKWSVQEILAHLADVEELGMRARVAAMVEQDVPVLRLFDQEKRAVEFRYDRQDYRKSLKSFMNQRRANVKWLRTLKTSQLKRQGKHEVVGIITAGEMIYEWAYHDLGHIKQILEVKRYGLWPRMGRMQEFYKLT